MKRTILQFLTGIGLTLSFFITAGCNEEVRTPESPEFSGIKFSVSSDSETSGGARVVITHDGDDRCTYFGFATKDVNADVASLVNREARMLAESGVDWKSQL
ncbi:MAG: hypothetical protein ACI3Z0_06155, partial [Candidatus Cryptobacteroides sp.]